MQKKETKANEIWTKIRGLQLDIFGLPNQQVSMYFTPVTIEPSKLYLEFNVQAAFPALETLLDKLYKGKILKDQYTVERDNKYVVVNKV